MECKKCGEADESKFYKSITTYCKEHWKERVRKNREEKAEYYKDYDRKRASLPHRVKAREEYAKTDAGKITGSKAKKRWAEAHAIQRGASQLVNNAVRDGKLKKPSACSNCGKCGRIEGHHDDYSKPLEVRWLCSKCHRQHHK